MSKSIKEKLAGIAQEYGLGAPAEQTIGNGRNVATGGAANDCIGDLAENSIGNGAYKQEKETEDISPGDRIVILPSGKVSISESAAYIFRRFAPLHTLYYRGGALVELVEEDDVSFLQVVDPEALRSRVEKLGRVVAWRVGDDGREVLKPTKMPQSDAKGIEPPELSSTR